MTYATSNPPKCVMPAVAGTGPSWWTYDSTDAGSAVDAAGYITDAKKLGMKVGDIVIVTDTDASPAATTAHRVVSIAADGSADLSDGIAFGSTNSD